MPIDRSDMLALDAADPLAPWRDRFDIPDGVVYLDGNSLGPLPKATRARLAEVVDREWGQDLIRSWTANDWIGLPRRVGALIAKVIGAAADEVVAADSTSVNIFKLAAAALSLRPDRKVIVSEPGNFPTDLYMLQGLRDLLGGGIEIRLVERDRLDAALTDEVALLLLTHVHYKTGAIHDMAALNRAAQAAGVLTLWDLSHSAGALDLDLTAARADMAVGCGYKYLNGGPGAPAFLYVARRHHASIRQPLSGWMGHDAPFAFDDDYRPAPGIDRHLCGTPSVLGMSALEVGAGISASADRAAVRAKAQRMGDIFLSVVRDRCGADGPLPACPLDSAARGNQISLSHPCGYAVVQALIERGIIGDFRAPDVMRFGFGSLYLRYAEVWDAAAALADVVNSGSYRDPRYQARAKVT